MKQAIVARADLNMSPGKLAAQVAHASLLAYERADTQDKTTWKKEGQKKIVLGVNSEAEIFDLADRAEREGIPVAVVRDAGHTQLEPGSVTTLGIGPAKENRIDAVTGHLSLY